MATETMNHQTRLDVYHDTIARVGSDPAYTDKRGVLRRAAARFSEGPLTRALTPPEKAFFNAHHQRAALLQKSTDHVRRQAEAALGTPPDDADEALWGRQQAWSAQLGEAVEQSLADPGFTAAHKQRVESSAKGGWLGDDAEAILAGHLQPELYGRVGALALHSEVGGNSFLTIEAPSILPELGNDGTAAVVARLRADGVLRPTDQWGNNVALVPDAVSQLREQPFYAPPPPQ